MESINKVIIINKPIRKIISEMNPILRGWGKHKRKGPNVQSKLIFTIDRRFISTTKKSNKNDFKHEWHLIDWKKVETRVKDPQEKITIATLKNDMKEICKVQWTLLNC